MAGRFDGLKKIPQAPAARLLAEANAKLATDHGLPAAAPVDQVLAELDRLEKPICMLRLLAAALPPRERIWWACLSCRDTLQPGLEPTPSLAAAEAWVFKPGDATRAAAHKANEDADIDDETGLVALAVAMHDGKLGPGELSNIDAPPGASAAAAFGMAMLSLAQATPESFEAHQQVLIDRALDIARGGSGRLPLPGAEPGDSQPAPMGEAAP